MNSIEEALEAVRLAESQKNYAYQQRVKIGGEVDTKLGAYGILKSKWVGLTQAAGYAGADWRDPRAQDSIARAKLQKDYDELGSWEMAALAFRYGSRAARGMMDAGYIEPKSIEDAGYKGMGQYLRTIRSQTPPPEPMSVEGTLNPQQEMKKASPDGTRAENIIRQHLRTMLNAQNKVAESTSATAEGDESTSAIAETVEEPV